MTEREMKSDEIDWQQAGFDGTRREQLRRWAALPLEDALDAVEAMGALSRELATPPYPEGAFLMEASRVAEGARLDGDSDGEHEIEYSECPPRS